MIYYIDTEFAHEILVSIGIVDRYGNTVMIVVIDYGLSLEELKDKILPGLSGMSARVARGVIEKSYGSYAPEIQRMTPHHVADALALLGFPNVVLVEWSNSRCDFHRLWKMLAPIGRTAVLPPVEDSILFIKHCREVFLPGFWCFKLPYLYPYMVPGSSLCATSHYADVDALKLFDIAA